jgi:uncharacterized protein (TIGR02147 family)
LVFGLRGVKLSHIYKFENYRSAFTALFIDKRREQKGWSTAKLAEKIRVQPSHITNVIKGRNHFSSDQIAEIGQQLYLESEEIIYLDLLMQWERSEHLPRKSRLLTEIQKTRSQKLRVNKQLKIDEAKLSSEDLEKYYLDPNYELLHLFLGVKNIPTEVNQIAKIWNLPIETVSEIIQFLKSRNLVEQKKNKWIVKPIHQMLPTSSPLCRPQQNLKRLRAQELVYKISPEKLYTFSAALTMSEDSKLAIQGLFVEFLKKVEKEVLNSNPENIYHFHFDLMPWIDHSQ